MSLFFEDSKFEKHRDREYFIQKNMLISNVRKVFPAKRKVCMICGKKITGKLCVSHSIPQFVLKNIASNGELLTGINIHNWDCKKSGILNAFTFSLICPDCDGKKFCDYEKVDFSSSMINQKALREIALKNYLRMYYKSDEVFNYCEGLGEDIFGEDNKRFLGYTMITELFNTCCYLKMINDVDKTNFYLIDYIELPYRTSVAFQSFVAVKVGFDGELINGLGKYEHRMIDELEYKYDNVINSLIKENYNHLHICVYPLEEKTQILLFIKDGNIKYRKFYKHFRKLNLQKKLYVINYILLQYSEEFAVNPLIYSKIKLTDETKKVLKLTTNYSSLTKPIIGDLDYDPILLKKTIENFTLKEEGNINNFLLDYNALIKKKE